MHEARGVLLGLVVLAALATPAAAAAQPFTLSDSLRGGTEGNAIGGSFGADGWTVTDRTDRLWYAVPRLQRGYVEFTVRNMSLGNMPLNDHEILTMYEAGYGISEPIRYAYYRENHYKGMIRVYGTAETPADRIGRQKLMWGMCPSGDPGYGACECESFHEEPIGGDRAWDGSPHVIRIEWGDGVTRLLRDGTEAVRIDWSASGLTYGPSEMHVSLGSSRSVAVATAGMPIGAVFSDLTIDGEEGPLAVCPGAADADADADADGGPDAETDAESDAASDAESDAETDADTGTEADAGTDTATDTGTDTGAEVRADADAGADGDVPAAPADGEGEGCGCRAARGGGGAAGLLLAALALLIRRRRLLSPPGP